MSNETIPEVVMPPGLYRYKNNTYWVVQHGCLSKNSVTGLWETHVVYFGAYKRTSLYTREINDFKEKFVQVGGQFVPPEEEKNQK